MAEKQSEFKKDKNQKPPLVKPDQPKNPPIVKPNPNEKKSGFLKNGDAGTKDVKKGGK